MSLSENGEPAWSRNENFPMDPDSAAFSTVESGVVASVAVSVGAFFLSEGVVDLLQPVSAPHTDNKETNRSVQITCDLGRGMSDGEVLAERKLALFLV